MSRFVLEVRKRDGTEYPPNTLYHFICGLQHYIRGSRPEVHFFQDQSVAGLISEQFWTLDEEGPEEGSWDQEKTSRATNRKRTVENRPARRPFPSSFGRHDAVHELPYGVEVNIVIFSMILHRFI